MLFAVDPEAVDIFMKTAVIQHTLTRKDLFRERVTRLEMYIDTTAFTA